MASSDDRLRSLLAWTLVQDDRFEVVGEATDGDGVLACPAPFRVALVDLTIGGLGILGVLRRLLRRPEDLAVVVVGHEKSGYVRDALRLEGAADYVLLPECVEELSDRVLAACVVDPPPVPSKRRSAA